MKVCHCLLFLFTIAVLGACSKSKPNTPPPPPPPVENQNLAPKDFIVFVDSVFDLRSVISWSFSEDPEGDTVKYDIWLQDKLVASNLTTWTFSFTALNELTTYSGRIAAKDSKGKKTEKTFSFTTEKYYFRFFKLYEYDRYIDELHPGGGEVKQITKMRDGNYIVVGASYRDGAYGNGSQIFAQKVDFAGNEIWKKYYPYDVGPAYDVAATESANGLLIVSYVSLLSIDTDGNLLWYKKIESYDDGDGGTEIRAVKEDAAGNIFIAGGRTAPEPDILQEGVVTKLDPSGNTVWEKAFKPTLRSFFYDLQITTSNELVVFGTRETDGITYEQHLNSDPPEQTDFWVLKLAEDGTQIWAKTYGDRRLDIPGKLIIKRNGNYVFAGSSWGVASDLQGRIFELAPDGTEIRNISYGKPLSFTLSVAETPDGGLVSTGFADVGSYAKGLQITKFNSNATEEWNQFYYQPGTFVFGRSILPEEDGGYRIAVSHAPYYGYGNPSHIAIIKTDPYGSFKQ